ncbi:hypothetical protein B0E37_06229 [Streptomyces sp. MH192]|nr:hypothetical protein [Streptomyces sp. MH192]MCF0103629.1 hypothetical protein [Streptomyces sp. MH191]
MAARQRCGALGPPGVLVGAGLLAGAAGVLLLGHPRERPAGSEQSAVPLVPAQGLGEPGERVQVDGRLEFDGAVQDRGG